MGFFAGKRTPLLLGAWLLLCLGLFLARGFLPSFEYGKDGLLVYTEARAWLEGVSPYDAAGLDPLAQRTRCDPLWPPTRRGNADLLYPPTTFVVLVPFAMFDWPIANLVWIGTSTLFTGVIAWSLCTIAGFGWRDPRAWVLVGICFAFAPLITSIKHGQTAILVFGLAMAGVALRVQGRCVLGGVLLGLASCVKPQVGLPILALEGWRRRWRVLIPGVLTLLLVTGVAVARLRGIDWIDQLRANVQAFTESGAGDPSQANAIRYQMVNLHPLVVDLLGTGIPVKPVVWGIVGLFGVLFFLVPRGSSRSRGDLLALTMVSTMGLMLVYHRSYDTIVLLTGYAWSLVAWREGGRTMTLTLALGCTIFALPWTGLFATLVERGMVPPSIASSEFWRIVVMGHQSIGLLLIGFVLLTIRYATTAPTDAIPEVRGG